MISHALRAVRLNHDAHLYWMDHDPTYPERFKKATKQWGDALRDRAHHFAVDGAAEMVLHEGRPVIVEGQHAVSRQVRQRVDNEAFSSLRQGNVRRDESYRNRHEVLGR